jgi:hypothetical protein
MGGYLMRQGPVMKLGLILGARMLLSVSALAQSVAEKTGDN